MMLADKKHNAKIFRKDSLKIFGAQCIDTTFPDQYLKVKWPPVHSGSDGKVDHRGRGQKHRQSPAKQP
jgi:hypothetical protein